MRTKFRLILPSMNVMVAIALLILGRQQLAGTLWARTSLGPPARRIGYAINAPVILVKYAIMSLWEIVRVTRVIDAALLDDCTFIVGVALLWYLVGRAMDWRLQGKSAIMPLSIVTRMTLDVVLILDALVVAVGGFDLLKELPGSVLGVSTASLNMTWALVLIAFAGRDMVLCISAKWSARTPVPR